jgi:hypothetical protein
MAALQRPFANVYTIQCTYYISKTVKWYKSLYFDTITKYKNPDENSHKCLS